MQHPVVFIRESHNGNGEKNEPAGAQCVGCMVGGAQVATLPTTFVVGTSVLLADEGFLTTHKLKHVHPKLAAYLIDLSMFRVKWVVDKSFF